jgi:mannose-6-phosphate isomerase-like protein (cupin superfamily)
MPVYKGKDVPEKRDMVCGALVKIYPVQPENDFLDWIVFRRTMADEEKWSMQLHSHPDFEEMWYVIKGQGKIICGDETYEVEEGDLVITPRGAPHKVIGDMTLICTTAKHNVYGQTIGHKMQYVANDEPYRDKPEEMIKEGQCQIRDMTSKKKR